MIEVLGSVVGQTTEIIDAVMRLANQNPSVVVGLVMPLVIEYLNKDVVNRREKVYVTMIACLFVSAVINYEDLLLRDIDQILNSFTIVLSGSQVVYQLYFKDSFFQKKIQKSVGKTEVIIPERIINKKDQKYTKLIEELS